MDFYRHLFGRNDAGSPLTFTLVYLASIIFTFINLVTSYSSSTYLERFVPTETVGLLFAVSAAIAIVLSLTLPRLLRHIGNVNTALLLITFVTIALLFLGLAPSTPVVIGAFIAYLSLAPQVFLNIDIFLEALIGTNEGSTGTRRGLILTLMSAAAFVSPLAMGYIIGPENNLAQVYFVGAGAGLVLIALIVSRFRQFLDPAYTTIRVRDMLRDAARDSDIRTVMTTQFLLQFFYTWAVVYIPLYLASTIGFDWPTISTILAAGLLAFVIFEYPTGYVADRHLGEKEMMAFGFVFLALAAAAMSFMAGYGVVGWMALMFVSRIGASLVEVTTESYFFKKVDGNQPNLIGLFRLMRPLANLLGTIAGSISLFFLPFHLIFLVLAVVMASGVFITSFLTDTK